MIYQKRMVIHTHEHARTHTALLTKSNYRPRFCQIHKHTYLLKMIHSFFAVSDINIIILTVCLRCCTSTYHHNGYHHQEEDDGTNRDRCCRRRLMGRRSSLHIQCQHWYRGGRQRISVWRSVECQMQRCSFVTCITLNNNNNNKGRARVIYIYSATTSNELIIFDGELR